MDELTGKPKERFSLIRRMVPLIGVLIAAGLIYDGAIFYSRWNDARQATRRQTEAETNHEQKVVDALGGDELKIIAFYANPRVISRGARIEICYGVTGAKTVRIEPPIGDVWPALSRCMQTASPGRDTDYKLTAEDGAGHSTTQDLAVKVR
jgi:hypothetical protein